MSRRFAPLLGLLAVVLGHVGMTLYSDPPSTILAPHPIAGFDWETHYGQTNNAAEAWERSGEIWTYNPQMLAGQPAGVVFDADNKGWEVWTVALEELGVPRPVAFNLFAWLVALLVPFVFYAASRLLELRPWTAVAAAALASACWHFDAESHFCAWVGMISWSSASYLWVLPFAVFWRWLSSRRPIWLFVLLLLLIVEHNIHPFVFVLLVIPMGIVYFRDIRKLAWHEHLGLAAVAVGTIVANLWWMVVSLRYWHYVQFSPPLFDPTLDFLLTDWLGLQHEPALTGVIAMRSAFRFLALGGAALALWLWRKERDRRFLPFAVMLVVMMFLAYAGGHFWVLQQTQPYRFALPAMYAAVIPAAWFLERGVVALRETKLSATAWALVGLLLFVTVPRFARDMIYFIPDLVPRQTKPLPAPPPDINGGIYFGAIRWPEPFDFRHHPEDSEDLQAVTDYVNAVDDGSGRWLVEWWMLGERLSWATRAQVLGGFKEVNLHHTDANLFRRFPGALPTPEQFREFLQQYNVRWVVISNPLPLLESRTELLRLETVIFKHRIYRVLQPSSFIVGGGPGTVQAALNRITVRGSAGGSLVLRYHWFETLRCRPGCRVRRVTVPGDRVGFVGVENAPADFEIYNSYGN